MEYCDKNRVHSEWKGLDFDNFLVNYLLEKKKWSRTKLDFLYDLFYLTKGRNERGGEEASRAQVRVREGRAQVQEFRLRQGDVRALALERGQI